MTIAITHAAIEEARAEFKRQLNETGVKSGVVVVARDVTRDDLASIPNDWLRGIELQHDADGTLTVHRLVALERLDAAEEAVQAIYKYAQPWRAQGIRACRGWEVDLVDYGRRTCDAALVQYDECGRDVAPIGVEIIVGTSTCNEMMTAARGFCYCYPTMKMKRGVVLQIFPPASPSTSELWEVPALAVVFGLADPSDRESDVRILEIQSFGNAGIPPAVVESLVSGELFPDVEPLEQERADMLLKPGIHHDIHDASVFKDVEAIRLRAQPVPLELRAPMPEPLEDMTFDLVAIFAAAVEGRALDQVRRTYFDQRGSATDGLMAPVYADPVFVGCL